MKKLLVLALLGTLASAAQAVVFNFSYTRGDGKMLAGQLNGTLQADNNVVVVSSLIGAPTLAGIAGPVLQFVYSTDASNFGTQGLQPRLSLNGSFMDFIACNFTATCSGRGDAFTFNAGNTSAATFGGNGAPFDAYDGFFGAFGETYVASRWRLAPVPELGTQALLAAGLAAVVALARRRRQLATAVGGAAST